MRVISGHFGPQGRPFWGTYEPFLWPNFSIGTHMEPFPPVCHFRWSEGQKKTHLYSFFYYRHFAYWDCYGFITPSWSPIYPKRPQMDQYPKVHALPRPPTKIQILFVSFFIFSRCKSISAQFWSFLTPHCVIWTLTSKSITLVWNQPENGLLLLRPFIFLIFYLSWSFLAFFSLWAFWRRYGPLLWPAVS